MYKLDLEKAEEPEIKYQHLLDHRKSKPIPAKHQSLLHWLHESLWLCGSQQTRKFWKRWEYQATIPASWQICMQVKKQELELDVKQWTGSKLGKEYLSAAYCHPAYLTSMQNKQRENIQPWSTPFPIWNLSVPCPVLIVASWPAYRFLRRQVKWPGIPISFRIFHSLLRSTQWKAWHNQ